MNLLEKVDCPELSRNLNLSREKLEGDWNQLKKVIELYPDTFGTVTKEIFDWAFQFVASRSFGWGLPSTSLVPLADAFNHRDGAPINISLIHKNLHIQSNKIYLHDTDFETFDYDKSSSRQDINVSRLFKDENVDPALINGKIPDKSLRKDYTSSFMQFLSV